MTARTVGAIFRKDVLDAVRDARILVSLVVPIVLGLFYNAVFPDERPVKLAYYAVEPTAIVDGIRAQVGPGVELRVREAASEEEARSLVAGDAVDVALVIPAGTDAAVRAGRPASLRLITKSADGLVHSALERALRAMSGQPPPAAVEVERLRSGPTGTEVLTQLGPRRYFVLATLVMLLAMIGLLAVPVILTEELEKKTIDALLLIARHSDVIVAKVLVGLAYVAVGVPLMLGLTRIGVGRPLTFVAGTALVSIGLAGLGLLLAGLLQSATRVYTWSGLVVLLAVAPAFAVGFPLPAWADIVLNATPTGQGMRLMTNGVAGRALFDAEWLGYVVLVLWIAASFALLRWQLLRREA